MEQFPPNSKKQPVEPKKIERVTSANAVRRKQPLGRRFADTFFKGDGRSVLSSVTQNVIVPSVRDLFFEVGMRALEEKIYGGSRKRPGGPPSGAYGHVAYNQPQTVAGRGAQPQRTSNPARARGTFDEIVVDSKQGAEEIIDRMMDVLSQYEAVTVADLYELTGFEASHTDHKWGWTDLRGASSTRLRTGGYLLDLPQPKPFE